MPIRKSSRKILIAAASVAAMSSLAHAQTSGSWIVEADGSWSEAAKWSPAIPDGGGVATFETLPTFILPAPRTINQDFANITLDRIVYNTPFTFVLRNPVAAPANTLTFTGNAEIRHTVPSTNGWNTSTNGQSFSLPIIGSAGLTRSGPGTVTMTLASTYTGGTTFTGGSITRPTAGDAVFGNASGALTFDGATVRTATTAFVSARTINLNGAGGTFETTASGATTLSGPIGGAGSLNKAGSALMTITGAGNYTGATFIGAGSVVYSGNGSSTATSAMLANGTITLDNSGTNVADRINNGAGITFTGSGLIMTGNAAGSAETLGVATFAQGITTIGTTPNAAAGATLTFAEAKRALGGAAFFRANSMGATPGANVGNVYFTTVPTLSASGGRGGVGTPISIIPWAYGADNSGSTSTSSGASLVTYSTNGVRALTPSEYLPDFSASTADDSVRVTSAQNIATAATAHAVVLTTGGSITGSGVLTLSSGVFLNTIPNATVSAGINFGGTEGILHVPNSITFSGPFTGSAGLTKTSIGAATFANAASTYTGPTIIGGGTTTYLTSVGSGVAGPFGSDTSAIVMAPGDFTSAKLIYGGAGAATFARGLDVKAFNAIGNQALLPQFGVSAAQSLTMNGDILIDFPLNFTGTSGAAITIAGKVSGSGFLTDFRATSTTLTLNGNNTHTGGIEMAASGNTWAVGSDTAFGTGTIKMVQLSGQPTIVAVGGPRIVPNNVLALSIAANFWTIGGVNDIDFTGDIVLANLGVAGAGTHTINNTGLTTYSGKLSIGGFIKAGTGTLLLSGDNTYNGIGTINVGVLRVGHSNALGTPLANTLVNTGATLEMTNNSLTTEPVTVNGTGIAAASGSGAVRSTSGNNSLGPITLASASSIGVDAGTLTVGNVGGAFGLTKVGGGTLNASRYRVSTLSVDTGIAAVTLGRDGPNKVSTVSGALTIAPGSGIDLGDNDLILQTATVAPVQALIAFARNGGAWDQFGISSTAARNRVPKITTLGVLSGAEYLAVTGPTFDGVTVNASDVLVRYTYYGDTDFNGIVNFDDYSRIDAGFNNGSTGWLNGDLDFNNVVNFDDYALVDLAFNAQSGTIARAAAFLDGSNPGVQGMNTPALQKVMAHFEEFGAPYAAGFLNAVPEPSALVGFLALAPMIRRRRKNLGND
ncbi:hypothetical protein BH09PLA1_BH09PLA1_11010 [soil metagenome]